MTVFQIVALGVVLIAVVWDVASRRIPNFLTFGSALAAIRRARVLQRVVRAWAFALTGWAVGVALFFPVFALGGMGAGDVKLLGAIGAWLGAASVIWVGLFSGIAGGVLAIVVAAFSGYLTQAFRNVWGLLLYWRVAGIRPQPELTLNRWPERPAVGLCGPDAGGSDGDPMVPINAIKRLKTERGAELIEFALVFPSAAVRHSRHRRLWLPLPTDGSGHQCRPRGRAHCRAPWLLRRPMFRPACRITSRRAGCRRRAANSCRRPCRNATITVTAGPPAVTVPAMQCRRHIFSRLYVPGPDDVLVRWNGVFVSAGQGSGGHA